MAVNATSLWLGEASLLGNTSLFVLAKRDWFRGKNRITNKGKISKYGTILLCFPLENVLQTPTTDCHRTGKENSSRSVFRKSYA